MIVRPLLPAISVILNSNLKFSNQIHIFVDILHTHQIQDLKGILLFIPQFPMKLVPFFVFFFFLKLMTKFNL